MDKAADVRKKKRQRQLTLKKMTKARTHLTELGGGTRGGAYGGAHGRAHGGARGGACGGVRGGDRGGVGWSSDKN